MCAGRGNKHSSKLLGAVKDNGFCAQRLAESIILQAIEDLWDNGIRNESIGFFSKKGFSTCAKIAGIDIYGQVKLLDMVNAAMPYRKSGLNAF